MAYLGSILLMSKSLSSRRSISNSIASEASSSDYENQQISPPLTPTTTAGPHRSLAVLSGHSGSVSCLALCGEFLLSASHGRDIIAWQQPDLRPFARFGHSTSGDGLVKSLVAVGSRVFSAHQDGRIRVWKVNPCSSSDENAFKLTATLPTKLDYWAKFLNQSNYVQTRRNSRKRLWIQHADTISCLAVAGGLIYSGSWDKTLKVWSLADLRCLQSIAAHHDAINSLVAHGGLLYSASADSTIKIWGLPTSSAASSSLLPPHHHELKACLRAGEKDVCWNSVIVCEEGRTVYGGGSDGRVVGWERDDKDGAWRVVCDVKAHELSVLCLCWTGEYVCSGSADKSIGVWRREVEGRGRRRGSLSRVGAIAGHDAPVKCLQAAEVRAGGGFMLYSGGLDKRLRVWWVPNHNQYEDSNTVQEDDWQGMKKCILLR